MGKKNIQVDSEVMPSHVMFSGGLRQWGVKKRSLCFLLFGVMLGPAIILFEHNPGESSVQWILLTLVCSGIILHRLSLRYTLSSSHLRATSWWGRGRVDEITLAYVGVVRPVQGFLGRMLGYGHLEISSEAITEPAIVILGQTKHLDLARSLEDLAEEARQEGELSVGK